VVENSPTSVGLGGDGDEIAAIDDVERAFGVKLDNGTLHVGSQRETYSLPSKSLPAEERDRPDVWKRFAVALCGQTGVNPDYIEPGSPLLSDSRLWARLADASAVVWIIVAVGLLVLLATAFF
jgi:hypothetical protein